MPFHFNRPSTEDSGPTLFVQNVNRLLKQIRLSKFSLQMACLFYAKYFKLNYIVNL